MDWITSRVSQITTKIVGYVGGSVTAAAVNELAGIILAVTTLAADIWLHYKQHGTILK